MSKNEVTGADGGPAEPVRLHEDWVAIGREVADLICQRLEFSRNDFAAEVADRMAGRLAVDIGLMALAAAKKEHAEAETQLLFSKLGVNHG